MRHLAQRVARLYTAKIPVPPRRGPRGKTVFLNALIAKLQKTIPPFAAASRDMANLSHGAMFRTYLPDIPQAAEDAAKTLKTLQESAKTIAQAGEDILSPNAPEYAYAVHQYAWRDASKAILNHPVQGDLFDALPRLFRQGARVQAPQAPGLGEHVARVEDAKRRDPQALDRDAFADMRDGFKSHDPEYAEYFQEIWQDFDRPKIREELLGLWHHEADLALRRADAALQKSRRPDWDFEALSEEDQAVAFAYLDRAQALRRILDDAKDRMEVYGQTGTSHETLQHPAIERYETLYHASVAAKKLFQNGFDKEVPAQAGLGGSQSAGGGKTGTSFTYDLYVAKEVARSLKELVMVAKGTLKARDIYAWAVRDGVIGDLVASKKLLLEAPYDFAQQKGTWVIVNARTGQTVSPDTAFDTPVKTAWLFKFYLLYMGKAGKRYDPLLMHVDRVVPVLARVNPKDVGIVAATVDMKHPDIRHAGGERELRVPPEAIVSADRFIPG